MGASEKMSAGMDKAKGKIEETVGHMTGDEGKVAEGKAEQAKGELKGAAERAKDAAKDAFDR
ncbi:CsbD family protein [Leucobacter sp. gxy201]|uniref:CsbD family protein n=1 Tax=Leucobacter sp. gxy201 TaxID=2957200 RepID=UPI003D9FB4F0